MKLLTKRELDLAKTKDRKLEIDEGAKLAKRVDVLRETHSQEERNLKQWREQAIPIVRKEIDDLLAQKTSLQSAVTAYREELAVERIPLDKQWEQVREREAENEAAREKLALGFGVLEREREENERASARLDVRERKVQNTEWKVEEILEESDKMRAEAKEVLLEAKKKRDDASKLEVDVNEKLASRERDILTREKSLEYEMDFIKKSKKEISRQFSRLKDRYAMLERDKKRIK